jgi:hypothetical protein
LLDSVPPLLTVRINPSPLRVCSPAKGHIGASNFDPMPRERLDRVRSLTGTANMRQQRDVPTWRPLPGQLQYS